LTVLIAALTLLLAAAVIVVVSGPLRRTRGAQQPPAERTALEAAREAKYRELRDTELDYRTGKLSREDYERLAGALRADAVEILDRLSELEDGGEGRP
jgi:hypothetical protein